VTKPAPEPRWLRLTELYWGAPRPRISPLTLRILALNAGTLLILIIGLAALGPYQRTLTATHLEAFSRLALVGAQALGQLPAGTDLGPVAERLALTIPAHVRVFGPDGTPRGSAWLAPSPDPAPRPSEKAMGVMAALISWMPRPAPVFPAWPEDDAPGLAEALAGQTHLAAWAAPEGSREHMLLSVSAPLPDGGAAIFVRGGQDIARALEDYSAGLLRTFALTLAATTALSIYLAGLIARPLRRLARAAEAVAAGRAPADAIPDLAARGDEIGELSTALRAMAGALAARVDANARFAADVAHELKNPLASARSALETIETTGPEHRDTLLAIARADVARMDRRVSDIARACRMEAALGTAPFGPVDLTALLPEARPVGPGPFVVRGQAEPLTQVFENVLSNAHSLARTVVVTLEARGAQIVVRVEDDGPGIPEGQEGAIFERFYTYRPDDARAEHSGLGLAIAWQIVEAHGGHITAENRAEGGARFTIRLPRG
jgi:two-component system, OmpR family, sensor histidine kinase ChvG